MPLAAYFHLVVIASVDVPYIDDYDAILRFLARFVEDESISGRLRHFFSRQNEHVMGTVHGATLFAYALRGSLDFTLLNLLGNGFLVVLLLVLFLAFRPAKAPAEKLLVFAPAALFLVHPQFFMVLVSATTSLSGFAATAWAALALLALRRGSRLAFGAAVACAAAATFSLGNGVLVLPIGALLLLLLGRPRRALAWGAMALLLLAAWLATDPMARRSGLVLPPAERILLYGLNLAGCAGAFSREGLSLLVGALLVASSAALAVRGLPRRNPVIFALLLFVLGSIAANTLLRAHQGPGAPLLQPRYRFYASLLLATSYLGWAELIRGRRAAQAWLGGCLAAALAFSFFSFRTYRGEVLDLSLRLRLGFEHWWNAGDSGLLYPDLGKASGRIVAALARGHLRLPDDLVERQAARPLAAALPRADGSVAIHLEAVHQDERALVVCGWAHVEERARDQEVAIVLRSRERVLVFPAHGVFRADLLRPGGSPEDRRRFRRLGRSGFRVVVPRREVDPGRYRIGVLVRRGDSAHLTYLDEPILLGSP